ncbi:hypothetical protein FK220_019690 [Flavobacteriaceae bacterium TP-CH-4]|uniref:Outer membrane protein beta-barrel domain-containing protein n=1 Tax=Pelagihabitans pacificus TaxID=2696054 RepID=A0A967AYS5_9FLAO|nr:hypothetical protein [Pelagihabitans pacificus]NHF61585.1 hypothetical protein [Pelagihabitans pacificus]
MKTLTILLFFFSIIASAQEEPPIEIKDNPLNIGLFHNISLADKLTLQNGLSVRENLGFHTLETPVRIKYHLSNEWSTFLGFQTRTVIEPNLEEFFNQIGKPSNSYFSIGTEYDFKNNATGDFTIGFPLDLQLGIKF